MSAERLYCYLCHARISSQSEIGGSVAFAYTSFPICWLCVNKEPK